MRQRLDEANAQQQQTTSAPAELDAIAEQVSTTGAACSPACGRRHGRSPRLSLCTLPACRFSAEHISDRRARLAAEAWARLHVRLVSDAAGGGRHGYVGAAGIRQDASEARLLTLLLLPTSRRTAAVHTCAAVLAGDAVPRRGGLERGDAASRRCRCMLLVLPPQQPRAPLPHGQSLSFLLCIRL